MKCSVCKKNIPETSLKCPYCKSRTGLLCSHCNTVNPLGNTVCKNCGQELVKICPNCHSVNLPISIKCRKCGTSFSSSPSKIQEENITSSGLDYKPKTVSQSDAVKILTEGLLSKNQKVFSVTGSKGIGKTTVLNKVILNCKKNDFEWCMGRCTPLTQLIPGGVVQDMLLNLFNLPKYYITKDELNKDAFEFFSKEFKFLNSDEISDFLNFLYNSKNGNYEDIIINKKYSFNILFKIFEAFSNTGKFVFVIDNFDFIDGFSFEFFTILIQNPDVWKKLKLVVLYEQHKPVLGYFGMGDKDIKSYVDINLSPMTAEELEKYLKMFSNSGEYISDREKEIIFLRSQGNPAFAQQSVQYCFDCQMSDRAFILPKTYIELVKSRLEILKKLNPQAYRVLCIASILGDKIFPPMLKEISALGAEEFSDTISYLVMSGFITKHSESEFGYKSLFFWENILSAIKSDKEFEEINIKTGKAVSVFSLNTGAILAGIAQNLKENRMAFDIWTRITRLSAYIGDINLYVIAQKQCLALLNEFNEDETVDIRYNISERLGKILTEYDPEEALEFLPDAIANARDNNKEDKEIELLGYLALCCKKTGNYFGDIECVDNVLKKLPPSGYEIETALIKASKIKSLIKVGHCAQAVNTIDNDIIPVLDGFISSPRLDKMVPLELVFDTKIMSMCNLAEALALQGNDRSFDVLAKLLELIEKKKIKDDELLCKIKIIQALANTMKGNFNTSFGVLQNITDKYGLEFSNLDNFNSEKSEIINNYGIIDIINRVLIKDYEGIQDSLFGAVKFANDTDDKFAKHLLKTFLGKIFFDRQQAKHAVEIYNEQVSVFAKEKNALGALLGWYFISQASIVTENPRNSVDIASRALEIAQNPQINNYFFIVLLKSVLAVGYMELSDFESAKINIESAIILAKKYSMNDLLTRLYLLYGKYYQEIGTLQSQNQKEYLKGANAMYDRAMTLILSNTHNIFLRKELDDAKNTLNSYCSLNGIGL